MAKRHPIRWRLEDAAVAALWNRSARLGPEQGSAAGARLMRRLGPLLPVHRIARQNIALAFPKLDAVARAAIASGMWDNLGRVAGEYPHLARLVSGEPELSGFEHLERGLAAGRGAVIAMAHLGNWELGPALLHRLSLPFRTIYRPPNNPRVAARLATMRKAVPSGAFIAKGADAGRQLLTALRRNEVVGILADQRASGGIVLPFLGAQALTTTAPARLALASGAPILPGRVERISGIQFRFEIGPPLPLSQEGAGAGRIDELTSAMNRALEAWVRARPEQWLWIHRRWR